MQTVAQRDELLPVEYALSHRRESDVGAIEGILWALAMSLPLYGAIIFLLMVT